MRASSWTSATRLAIGLTAAIASGTPSFLVFAKEVELPASGSMHPIPEFAPVTSVFVSEDLLTKEYHGAELLTQIVAAGADVTVATPEPRDRKAFATALEAIGVKAKVLAHVRSLMLPHGNIWLRDYGPLMFAHRTPKPIEQDSLAFASLRYDDPSTKLNNEFAALLGHVFKVPTIPLPLSLDGGNFLSDGDFCFTSSADLTRSKELPASQGALELPQYGAALGCRKTIVITDPPHAHLDMWMKLTGEHSVLVNELDDETVAAAGSYFGHVPPEIMELRDALNLKAKELAATLKVRRLPMPLPYRGVFRTYANALLVNGHAIIPAYDRYGWGYDSYPDRALKTKIEAKVAKVYRDAGFQPGFVNADGLIYNGGSFHCVTIQEPKLASPRLTPQLPDDPRVP